MVIQTETNPEKTFDSNPFCQSSLSIGSPGSTEHSLMESTELETRIALIQGEGEWICGTDLIQKGSGKNRPRLLPQDVKMMVFVEKESEKTPDCPGSSSSNVPRHKVEEEELCTKKALHNVKVYEKSKSTKPKQFLYIHPKKKFLKRFIQDQDYC